VMLSKRRFMAGFLDAIGEPPSNPRRALRHYRREALPPRTPVTLMTGMHDLRMRSRLIPCSV